LSPSRIGAFQKKEKTLATRVSGSALSSMTDLAKQCVRYVFQSHTTREVLMRQ